MTAQTEPEHDSYIVIVVDRHTGATSRLSGTFGAQDIADQAARDMATPERAAFAVGLI